MIFSGFKNARRGFTITELLVMVGVFVVISGMLIANYVVNRGAQNLRASAQVLVEHIRQAQTLAYANTSQLLCTDNLVCGSGSSCDPGPGGCTSRYVSSYGVQLNTDGTGKKYALFSDYATQGSYVAGEAVLSGLITLPKDIVISSIVPSGNNPIIYTFNTQNASPFASCAANCTTTITLQNTVTGATRTVIVQKQTGAVTLQ